MEPAGIGAESLRQCLMIQAKRAGRADKILADLIKYYLEDIASCRYKKITDELCITRKKLTEYIELIKSFNPRPSRGFGDDTAEYIIPDVLVSFRCDDWEILLNDKWIGCVGINKLYKSYADNAEDECVREYLKDKIRRTKFIVKSIEQRRDTLLKITRYILENQLGFITGTDFLKVMSLNDVADGLGIHSSTVCRAIRDKYIQIPKGVYSFRSFFAGKAGRSLLADNEETSNAKVKAVLKEIIRKENRRSPLSDSTLSKELEKHRIMLSRRTIAKYRKELGLPNAADRRIL